MNTLTTLLVSLLALAPPAEQGPAVYEKDIKFLLDELEKRAGSLLALKKVDWKAVRTEALRDVKRVKSDAEHVKLASRLLARLKDGHAALIDLKVQPPDESRGRKWTGPRVHLVPIGDRFFVRQAFGSAEKAGVRPGMEVLKIDGAPIRAWIAKTVERLSLDTGFSTPQAAVYAACHQGLANWESTSIKLEVFVDNKLKRGFQLMRSGGPNFVPIGPVFPPPGVETVGRQSYGKLPDGTAYIHLRDVPENLPEQLDSMLAKVGDSPGLILDCRANGGGGCDHAAVFGRFVPRNSKWRQYESAGPNPYGGPIVVIVDAGVRSAGETIAGQLKEDGRAYMIGDGPTAGSSSQKEKLPVPSGLFTAYFSVASNKGRFNDGRGIEGIGVAPHEVVPYNPADLAASVDTQIRRAAALLKSGFPSGKVPYQPR